VARIGHASAAAALRYQHVIGGQDAAIVHYLERFGAEPPVPSRAHDDTPESARGGHAVGTPTDPAQVMDGPQPRDVDFPGGDDSAQRSVTADAGGSRAYAEFPRSPLRME
jgi:hypothetical protein